MITSSPYQLIIDNHKSNLTIVAFSGLSTTNHLFEWMRSFESIEANFIGIKDNSRSWFLSNEEELITELKETIKSLGKKVYFLGGSMGGFAALYFGWQLNADKILAFSPQSATGDSRRILGDDRWPFPEDSSFGLDISSIKIKNSIIHYGYTNQFDFLHANRLQVDVKIGYNYSWHNLPHWLKEQGKLNKILEEMVSL